MTSFPNIKSNKAGKELQFYNLYNLEKKEKFP